MTNALSKSIGEARAHGEKLTQAIAERRARIAELQQLEAHEADVQSRANSVVDQLRTYNAALRGGVHPSKFTELLITSRDFDARTIAASLPAEYWLFAQIFPEELAKFLTGKAEAGRRSAGPTLEERAERLTKLNAELEQLQREYDELAEAVAGLSRTVVPPRQPDTGFVGQIDPSSVHGPYRDPREAA